MGNFGDLLVRKLLDIAENNRRPVGLCYFSKFLFNTGAQLVIGFAAETENVLENARQKLLSKNLDAIVVNDVSREGVGFDSDRNAVTIITREDVVEVPETTKWEVAQRVLDQVVRLRQRKSVKA